MRRLDGVARSDDEYREARDDYAHAVVVHFFGYATPGLIERARKDRSLNDRKPWVRCALERARFS